MSNIFLTLNLNDNSTVKCYKSGGKDAKEAEGVQAAVNRNRN
jgi:hypothetical protein